MDESTHDIWVGSQYADSRPRILILGESVYGDDPPLRVYVPKWIDGHGDYTLTRVFNAFAGVRRESATKDQLRSFWDSIGFYNYVTSPVSTSKARPATAEFLAARQPLREVLREYSPDGVMVLGTGQSKYSAPVISDLGIRCVVSPHPRSGVSDSALTERWNQLRDLLSASGP